MSDYWKRTIIVSSMQLAMHEVMDNRGTGEAEKGISWIERGDKCYASKKIGERISI